MQKMNVALVLSSLLFSVSSYASCMNLSGTYGYADSDNTMTIRQHSCSTLSISYNDTDQADDSFPLDGVFRPNGEHSSDSYSASEDGILIRTNFYNRPASEPVKNEKTLYTLDPATHDLIIIVTKYNQEGQAIGSTTSIRPIHRRQPQ